MMKLILKNNAFSDQKFWFKTIIWNITLKVCFIMSISDARPIANNKLADASVFNILTKSFDINAPGKQSG